MKIIRLPDLPERSFLQKFCSQRAYTDGFCAVTPQTIALADYIEAFYTTWLFKLERCVLAVLVRKPSSDADAIDLASGGSRRFAAWTVEERDATQLLMCDYLSKTRSWLMCEQMASGGTCLYFGSAIVPDRILPNGRVDLGLGFHLLLGFHKLYSRALLSATVSLLTRQSRGAAI